MLRKVLLSILLLAMIPSFVFSKNRFTDQADINVETFFSEENSIYVIRYCHRFTDTLFIPSNCIIVFDGGSLSGPIVFNETKLSGKVNLKGSFISGSIKNKKFNASWICSMDGITDDALAINQIIRLCETVFFPKGQYRLISQYEAVDVEDAYRARIHSHLGINYSNRKLKGEKGACFISSEPLGMITIYSQPYDIENSIKNICIENLIFKVENDGVNFHEFMLTIETMGINGLTIKNCFFDDFWGDAICLSHYGDRPNTGERTRNQNVRILNNTIIGANHHNNRNGISVINGENVLIKNNIIKNTSRKDMPGGIDIEPNNVAYTIKNINIEDNIIEGVRGTMGAIGIVLPREGAPAYDVSIVNNIIRDCSWGISVCVTTDMTSSNFLIAGNHTDYKTSPYNFGGGGSSKDWIIKNNVWDKPRSQVIPGTIKVKNLMIKNNKKKV